MLALFYLDPLPRFFDHLALNFRLLDQLLRLFLAWRWVEQPAYWIFGWIAGKSLQILKKPVYYIQTGVQANHVRLWFMFLPFGCPDGRQSSLRIARHLDENSIFWDWRIMIASAVSLAPINQHVYVLCSRFLCRWGYHWGQLSQKRRISLLRSCWYNPRTWLVCWSIQKTCPNTWNGHSGSWRPSSICLLS